MEIVPVSVGTTARDWDEQHLDLEGAARELIVADTAGFTEPVRAAAEAFARYWEVLTRRLGTDAEAHADGLRKVVHAHLSADQQSGTRLGNLSGVPLAAHDTEVR